MFSLINFQKTQRWSWLYSKISGKKRFGVYAIAVSFFTKCFGKLLEKLYPLKGENRRKMSRIRSLLSWKPAFQEAFLLSLQLVDLWIKILLWIFKFAFEIKLCWKTRPHVNFGPFFGTQRWITLDRNKISKIANKVLEKRQLRGSGPNFKTKALAVRKLRLL